MPTRRNPASHSPPDPEKRILMISTHGYVSYPMQLGRTDTGGQVAFVIELSRKLGELGYAVDIFTRQFESQPPIDRVTDDVRIVRIPYGGREFVRKEEMRPLMPEFARNALKFIRRRKLHYDFVDSHYWDAGLGAMLLTRHLRSRHFHTPHSLGIWKRDNIGGDPAANERHWRFASRIQVERRLYRAARKVIATTVQQEDVLVQSYRLPPSRVVVLPPGFDEERFAPETSTSVERIRRKLQLPDRFILSLGRLAHNKGYDLLLRAFAFLVSHELVGPDVFLVLAAGGKVVTDDDRERIASLRALAARLRVKRRIRWIGYVDDEDLPALYDCADVFVMPSRYEPFGMVAVESMACGTPTVITTEGGLCRDVSYGRDALYANPFRTEEFAVTMAMPLNYPRIAERMRRRGSMKAHSDYTWMSIAQRTLALFRDEP